MQIPFSTTVLDSFTIVCHDNPDKLYYKIISESIHSECFDGIISLILKSRNVKNQD